MSKTLEMTFRNEMGSPVTLSLASPKADLTLAGVQAAMQKIITKNIFTTTGGDLTQIVEAQIREVNVTTLA